jgi:hypothetical protein
MFFSIASEHRPNFSNFYKLGDFCVSTDAGWNQAEFDTYKILYKGYADCAGLVDLLPAIVQQVEPELTGNFCAIVFDQHFESIQIKTDRYRGFPIYMKSGQQVTNLTPLGQTAWTDSLILIDQEFNITETKFDLIGKIDTSPLSVDQVLTQVNQILDQRTQEFLSHNQLPIHAFLSGGVDSLLVYSYLQKFTDQYQLVKCQHVDYDRFWLLNSDTMKEQFWGYSQIHHWTQPCVLTSGAPGDEYTLRSPTTVDLWLKFHKQSMVELLEQPQWQTCLHHVYFKRSKNFEIFKQQTLDSNWNKSDLHWNLCNIVANDWQHWHIGHTLTWTPLKDLEIFKLFLRLPADQALGQIMNSDISIQLIENNKPGLSKLISNQKNSNNQMSNLCDFLLQGT